MTEIKKFYSDDKLNKGYSKETKNEAIFASTNILPPVSILSQYEEFQPGITKDIIDLAKQEQEKRFAVEKATIQAHERAEKLGSVISLLSLIVICSAAYKISCVDVSTSIIFSAIAFSTIFLISIMGYLGRYSSKGHNHRRNNHNNNPNQKKPDSQTTPVDNANSKVPNKRFKNKRRKY